MAPLNTHSKVVYIYISLIPQLCRDVAASLPFEPVALTIPVYVSKIPHNCYMYAVIIQVLTLLYLFTDQPAKLELFISYGREDITNDFVQKLRDDLKYQNWNVFLDTHNIDHAESLSDKLAKEISKSDGMIIILSKKSCKSKWCEREVKYADQENKKIFVVKREDIDPPPYLKFILGDDLWFSLYDDDQEQYQSVLEKMIRTLKKVMPITFQKCLIIYFSFLVGAKQKRALTLFSYILSICVFW